MAGKAKHKKKGGGGHHAPSNSTNYAPKLSEQQLCDLTMQATQINVLLNQRHEKLKQLKDFAFLLSTKWLREWKQYVGYNVLFNDEKQESKKVGKKKPGLPNNDLTASGKDYLQIPEQLQEYSYLNIVINEKMQMNDDYIAIDKQLWDRFNQIYGPGTQIMRPLRITKSKTAYVDGSLQSCDVIIINYNQQEFDKKIQHCKPSKAAIMQAVPDYKLQFSKIWELTNLYEFVEKLCLVKYNSDKVTLWLCQNFIGTYSLQQSFVKAVKQKNYEMYATKLEKDDYEDLDVDDFIKSNYTLIVQVGESRIKSKDLPDEIYGFCEQCVEKRQLKYHCTCQHKHYCSKTCQTDDQVFHYKSCSHAFQTPDDELYEKIKLEGASIGSKCGLKNLGNTCYMNSSIQTFIALDFIVDFLTSNRYKNAISKKQKDATLFLQKISKTFKQMGQQTNMGSIQPWDLKGQVNYFLVPFQGYKQHDAVDFFMGFINTINDCLEKQNSDEAYHSIIKNNLIGQFDSLVICPECNMEVKNNEVFTQLLLPIKGKVNKTVYNYAVFDNPFSCRHGKAQLRNTWESMKSQIGVSSDCLIFSGSEGESGFSSVDIDVAPEASLKKFKKQLLFYPYQKINNDQIMFSANFITIKTISGQNMKANVGYPFPIKANINTSMGHFFIDLIRKLNLDKNQQILQNIQKQYIRIMEKEKEIKDQKTQTSTVATEIKENSSKKQNKQSKQKQNSKQKKQQQLQHNKMSQQTTKQILSLNSQLQTILSELSLKIFAQDTKKIRNICYFCKRRCDGCQLNADFSVKVADLLAPKLDEARFFINISPKPELIKFRQDLASSGEATVKDCLNLFGEPEKLDQQNAWYCPQCEDMRLALKQLHVSKFPRYLIIQLSRFKNGANGKVKNNEPITYNEYQTFGGHKYQLLSVIIHQGSIEGGHYWAICRRGDDYFIFNDEKVSKTEKIVNKNAYILCYKRLEEESKK